MGCGTWSSTRFAAYSEDHSRTYDATTGRVFGQSYTARSLDKDLNPYGVIRECLNTEEHPNTIPVILALDVTGSMGAACSECAACINQIMTSLYKKYKDIEFMVMGIGDLAYDSSPIQASQFESDIRIVEHMDKVYMERGGGGNNYESYTAAWYFGTYRCKLDCWSQGRKGIIITIGDESINPSLQVNALKGSIGTTDSDKIKVQGYSIETKSLYEAASKKYDIYHIAVADKSTSWSYHKNDKQCWIDILGDNFKESTVNSLPDTICQCIANSVNKDTHEVTWNGVSISETEDEAALNDIKINNGFITW